MVVVRFAPSPTGIPHIGNTRTALFNFLFARHSNGKFILRIEDTDQKRIVKGAEEAIYEILDWLGLKPDEKYKQSQRLQIYQDHVKELVNKKIAYEKDGAIYVSVPENKIFSWTDAVGNKEISFSGKDVEDFVILKSDGFPTYHLANVVDDYLMKISHVIRGEEWISSTPKHLFLYESFGWKPPVFVHLPVILGPDRTKLSKRHGAKSVLELRDEGFLKEAILNFMGLLGWNPLGNKEVMDLQEMISLFDLKDVNVANPVFDIKKLEWMNGVYIRKKSIDELSNELRNLPFNKQSLFLRKDSDLYKDERSFKAIVELTQTRMTTLKDFFRLADPMFFTQVKININKAQLSIIKNLAEELGKISNWNQDSIFESLKNVLVKQRIKMPIFYKIFTGGESGLPLPASLEILGKEKVLSRLSKTYS